MQHGLLVVDKPVGMTSNDVSRHLKRTFSGKVKMGHVGTLDPGASGVLPIVLGKATKFQDHLLEKPKAYEFTIQFGAKTTTLDHDGEVVAEKPIPKLNRQMLQSAADQLTGDVSQIPPMYSARKFQGKALYKYAREGLSPEVPIERLSKVVHISSFELLDFDEKSASFRASCSKGTYIRTLGEQLSEIIGTYGFIASLRRISCAGVSLDNATLLEELTSEDMIWSKVMPLSDLALGMLKWQCYIPGVKRKLISGQRVTIVKKIFDQGIVNWTESQLELSMTSPLMFLDEAGQPMGLGQYRGATQGEIELKMKRVLQ